MCLQTTECNILQWDWAGWSRGSTGYSDFIKIISFSRPVSNGTSWMLRSQPEPQDSKISETDIHQAVFMTVNRCYQGNKAHLFDIHYSIFSTTEEDVTSPPKCPFIFVPVPQLEAFTMKYKSYKEYDSICNGI